MTAKAMNAIIPKIVDELEKKQPRIDFPEVTKDLLGTYQGNTIFSMWKTKDTDSTGIFAGKLHVYDILCAYDAKTTDAYNVKGAYFFRLHMAMTAGSDSCFALTMLGSDDQLVLFQYDEAKKNWVATVADLLLEGEKKSSPSSGDDSSCPGLRPALFNLFITIPLAWLLCHLL